MAFYDGMPVLIMLPPFKQYCSSKRYSTETKDVLKRWSSENSWEPYFSQKRDTWPWPAGAGSRSVV